MPGEDARIAEAVERLRAASDEATKGTAYTCEPPWFRNASGVLIGSPDPHAGYLIADTDTSMLDPDNHDQLDDDCNAAFIAEAWNFARLVLSRPDLIAALRRPDDGGSEGAGGVPRGWVLVPREPTRNMLCAWMGYVAGASVPDPTYEKCLRMYYRRMIDSLPASATEAEGRNAEGGSVHEGAARRGRSKTPVPQQQTEGTGDV